MVLNLGAITRSTGGTVDFTLPSGTQSATNGVTATNSNDAGGILGGYATVGGASWATVSGGNIIALASGSYTNDTWATANATTVTLASNAAYNNVNTDSLRFNNSAADTVNLTGTNTINSGGVLVTSAVGGNASAISGGTRSPAQAART